MATVANLVDRTRLEISDQATPFDVTFSGDGETTRFDTNQYPVDSTGLLLTLNGVAQTSNQAAIDERTGVITFATAPASGDAIRFAGTRYRFFGPTDMENFVKTALAEHLYHRTDAFGRTLTVANLPAVEEYPVTCLAAYMALMALATDASFDIDIQAPDGVSIPRSERYRQLLEMMATRQQQYKELCTALNIGLNRIEVFTLRRISRTTNKLVPVYMAQEIDDYSKPQRVYLPANTYGSDAIPEDAGRYDLVLTQGDSFEFTMDFPFDLTGYAAKAQIRLYPESQIAWAEFTIEVVDATAGQIKLSLPPSKTTKLPLKTFWDIQLTTPADPNFVQTYTRGMVFCQRQVTREGGLGQDNLPGIYPPLLSGDAQEGFQPLTVFDGTGQGT